MSTHKEEYRSNKTLTTGQVAKMFDVAPRTVSKWVDSGLLKGYRIPGSGGDRRIPVSEVMKFVRKNDIPYGILNYESCLQSITPVLCMSNELRELQELLPECDGWIFSFANNALSVGIAIAEHPPTIAVVDMNVGILEGSTVARYLQGCRKNFIIPIIIITCEDRIPSDFHSLTNPSMILQRPISILTIANKIKEVSDRSKS